MNVDVVKYSKRNGAQIIDAKEVLDRILADGVEDIKIIIDIGCGTGNVTKIVAETLPHQKLYAFDIDPKMIELAKSANETISTIEFLIDDISAPWEELNQTLRDLDGKVDIAWSNRVLHWIPDELRHRAAQNIVRLLRPGGRLYINTTLTNDMNLSLPQEEREANEKLMKVPSKERQLEMWKEDFSNTGLSNFTVDYMEKVWDHGCNEIFRGHLEYFHFWKRYIPKDVPQEKHEEILAQFGEKLLKSIGHPIGSPLVNPIESLTAWYYGQYRIIGTK